MTRPTIVTLCERFWSKVNKNGPICERLGTRCWEWTAYVSPKGYGSFKLDGKARPAHIVAYNLTHGKVPEGLQLDHLCRNRKCVNPDHLEPVTNQVNTLRGDTIPAAYAKATHCKRGHELTVSNIVPGFSYRLCLQCFRTRNRARSKRYRDRKAALHV